MLLILLLSLPRAAQAGPVDQYGFGAAAMGRGLGGIALPGDAAGVFLNPAGLSRLPGSQAMLGYSLLRQDLVDLPAVRWDTNRDGVVDESDPLLQPSSDYGRADGIQFALGRNIGSRFGLAINAFVPTDRLLDIGTFEPSLPAYFMYENRPRRFEAAVGFGYEQLPGLSIGGAVQVLSRARYSISATLTGAATAAAEGDEQASDLVTDVTLDIHAMSLDLEPDFAPMIAAMWDVGQIAPPLEGLHVGATWRGAVGLPVDVEVDLQIDGTVEDVGDFSALGLTLLAPFELAVYDHYLPAQWGLGLGWDRAERLRAYLDARYTLWEDLPINIAQVREGTVQGQLFAGEELTIADGNPYAAELRSTWSVRTGAEIFLPTFRLDGLFDGTAAEGFGTLRPIVRGGWSLEPSPLVGIGRNVAILDTDRMVLTAGLGVEHGTPFNLLEGPVTWDVYYQHHALASGDITVSYDDPFTPGAPARGSSIPVGGRLWAAGLQWRMDY